jgi:hypothetical protein
MILTTINVANARCRTKSPPMNQVIVDPAMINWPEMLHHAEDRADGFWAGACATSLIAIARTALVLFGHAI